MGLRDVGLGSGGLCYWDLRIEVLVFCEDVLVFGCAVGGCVSGDM